MLSFRTTEIDRFPGKNYKFQSLSRAASRDLVMNAAAQKQSHVVILPYFCVSEIDRYLTVARSLGQFGSQATRYEFLLAASPKIDVSQRYTMRLPRLRPRLAFNVQRRFSVTRKARPQCSGTAWITSLAT